MIPTPLDRDSWSFQRCDTCRERQAQLTIDREPNNKRHGRYSRHCWLCYWNARIWALGPIVNCGPMWDGVDLRREL